MFYKRWIVIAIAALLVFGLISAISGAGQREAWMQGYLAGRLSASGEGGADLAPYLMSGGAIGPRYGGFGPGLFVGLGFLALGFFLISRRLHGPRGSGKPEEWHEHMRREAERWHQRHHGGWEGGTGGPGAADEERMV